MAKTRGICRFNVDVSKIASSFGGGGHKKAAGASGLKELPEFLRQGKQRYDNNR